MHPVSGVAGNRTFNPALNEDSGQLKVWTTGGGVGGGNDGLVSVNFRCENGITQPGDSIYSVGNLAQLGNWAPASAVRLTDVSSYPAWKGSISLPAQQAVEWKCIVRSDASPTQVKSWQPGANNRVTSAEGATTVGRL